MLSNFLAPILTASAFLALSKSLLDLAGVAFGPPMLAFLFLIDEIN